MITIEIVCMTDCDLAAVVKQHERVIPALPKRLARGVTRSRYNDTRDQKPGVGKTLGFLMILCMARSALVERKMKGRHWVNTLYDRRWPFSDRGGRDLKDMRWAGG